MIKRIEKYLDKLFDAPEQHCDGCGEEVVSYLLTHIPMWDGDYCKRCLIYEEAGEEHEA